MRKILSFLGTLAIIALTQSNALKTNGIESSKPSKGESND